MATKTLAVFKEIQGRFSPSAGSEIDQGIGVENRKDDRTEKSWLTSDELRSDRVQRNELTPIKMAAGVIQLMVVLCLFFSLLQLSDPEALAAFVKWILGAVLLQLITITFVLMEKRG